MKRKGIKNEKVTLEIVTDPEHTAVLAGLHYVTDEEPGYRRKRWGRGFTYVDPKGDTVTDDNVRARIESLVIPPAWTNVWICSSPDGHLQVTGRDEKGRKQYIYHSEWDRIRNETKFSRMIPFGEALPELRLRTERDLRRQKLSRDKVLATVLTLLDRTLIRVGNDMYARENSSYGLTTLRDRHVDFSTQGVSFCFKGKSGIQHTIELSDPRLARIVRSCREIPGYDLFQYYDENGSRRTVSSTEVNAYIRDTTGQDFTAKDFRTWGGSVRAATVLDAIGPAESEKMAKKNVVDTVKRVAAELGNTPAICRKYYIHPALIEAYETGSFYPAWHRFLEEAPIPHLDPVESAFLLFLRER